MNLIYDILFRGNFLRPQPLGLTKINKEIADHYYQLSFGMIGGVRLFNTYKQKYTIGEDVYKVKRKGDFNLTPFKLEPTIRFGRENIGVFLNYDLLTLFEKGRHESLHPFTIGITYAGF